MVSKIFYFHPYLGKRIQFDSYPHFCSIYIWIAINISPRVLNLHLEPFQGRWWNISYCWWFRNPAVALAEVGSLSPFLSIYIYIYIHTYSTWLPSSEPLFLSGVTCHQCGTISHPTNFRSFVDTTCTLPQEKRLTLIMQATSHWHSIKHVCKKQRFTRTVFNP